MTQFQRSQESERSPGLRYSPGSERPPEFRLLVITVPGALPGEPALLRRLIGLGPFRLHLRKPDLAPDAIRAYLDYFTRSEKSRIVVHSSDESLAKTGIGGLHLPFSALPECRLLKARLRECPVSTSIHCWQEYVALPDGIAYAFMGPVYDSLSKPGYRRNSQSWQLPFRRPVPLIALGGIHPGNINAVRQAGFNGAALLGSIWRAGNAAEAFLAVENALKQINNDK